MEDKDYVELYARKLRKNNALFKQQKMLIESQLEASRSLFRNMFGEGDSFKHNARTFLKKIHLYNI